MREKERKSLFLGTVEETKIDLIQLMQCEKFETPENITLALNFPYDELQNFPEKLVEVMLREMFIQRSYL